jgi:hypothetical protein
VNKKIIQTSYDGLRDGGQFIYAHKNREIIFSHLPPEWFCDWEFIPRNMQEVMTLFETSNLSNAYYSIDWDSTKDVFFVDLLKNPGPQNKYIQLNSNQPSVNGLKRHPHTA